MTESSCYVAEFMYDATESDELSLEPGDIILDAQPAKDDGWMTGRKESTGKTGLFPDNFVVKCSRATLRMAHQRIPAGASVYVVQRSAQQSVVYAGKVHGGRITLPNSCLNFNNSTGTAASQQPASNPAAPSAGAKQRTSHIVGGVGLGNIFDGVPITLKRAEDQRGIVASKPTAPAPQPAQSLDDLVIVQFKYEASSPDELSLEPGQIVRVLSRRVEDEGWWRGEIDGRVGVFPDNFVAPYKPPAAHSAPSPVSAAVRGVDRPLPPQPAAKPSVAQHQPPPPPPKTNVAKPVLQRPAAADPASNGPSVAVKEAAPTPPPAVASPQAGDLSADYEELRQELQQLQQQDEERRRELQELQRFKRTAQQDIASLKEDLDQMSKKYLAVTVDLDRLKKELQTLSQK